jgi:cell division septation protein DedD
MSAGQVVLVTFGFLIGSFLVFIFGMWVGKDIAERRLAQEERVFRAPIVRPTPAAVAGLEPGSAVAPAARTPATPARVFQLPLEPTQTPVAGVLPPTVTATLNLVVLPRTPARPRAVATPDGSSADEWADAGWTVQVTATTDAANAEAIASRLRSRGFDAYTLKAPNRGQLWYRVRVGRFATRAEAQEAETKLKTVENLTGAFVTAR